MTDNNQITIKIILLDGKDATIDAILTEKASKALTDICAKYSYENPMEFYLVEKESQTKLSPVETLSSQGINSRSVLVVRKRTRAEIRKNTKSAKENMKKFHKEKQKEKRIQEEKESSSKPTQLGSWFSKTFSVRKNESFDRLENDVPPIVEDIVSWIQTYGLETEGLFRVSGDVKVMHTIVAKYKAGKKYPDFKKFPMHTVAGALKWWLRNLPECVFTMELYDAFMAATRIKENTERISCINRGLLTLPPGNQAIIKRIFGLLVKIDENSAVNKMNASNLATCLNGSMLFRESNDLESTIRDFAETKFLIQDMITFWDQLFKETFSLNIYDPKLRRGAVFAKRFRVGADLIKKSMLIEQEEKQSTESDSVTETSQSEESTPTSSREYPDSNSESNSATSTPQEQPHQDKVKPTQGSNSSLSPRNEDRVPPTELVQWLLEGHIMEVEDYLMSLSEEEQSSTRNLIITDFANKLKFTRERSMTRRALTEEDSEDEEAFSRRTPSIPHTAALSLTVLSHLMNQSYYLKAEDNNNNNNDDENDLKEQHYGTIQSLLSHMQPEEASKIETQAANIVQSMKGRKKSAV